MNRRIFLKLGAGSLVLGSMGYVLFRTSEGAFKTYVRGIITEHLQQGDLIASGVDQFAVDIRHAPYVNYQAKGLVFVLNTITGAPNDPVSNDFLEKYRGEFNRRIISDYLLSSDFFFETKGPGATVNYIGYANRMCAQANPFAKFLDT